MPLVEDPRDRDLVLIGIGFFLGVVFVLAALAVRWAWMY